MTTPESLLDRSLDQSYKQKVASRFSKAALSYDRYAVFQEQVLALLLRDISPQSGQCWLDLGTGTGRALEWLSQQNLNLQLLGLDLSDSMLIQAQARVQDAQYVCADAESLPFVENCFDGVISSLVIQWCQSPNVLFSELGRVLKPSGTIVLSTLLEGSMFELGEAWRCVDQRSHHNHYPCLNDLLQYVQGSGLTLVEARQQRMTLHYETVKEVVYSLKKVGASLVTDGQSVVTPSKWKTFEAAYREHQNAQGIPLSYEVGFITLRKDVHG